MQSEHFRCPISCLASGRIGLLAEARPARYPIVPSIDVITAQTNHIDSPVVATAAVSRRGPQFAIGAVTLQAERVRGPSIGFARTTSIHRELVRGPVIAVTIVP